ncbi:hypothetical protein FHX34_104327 [Actinoplanes teichomyceticus]|uniref:Uncharacterized protein n=1 Tax=Actinoplanes teichomyceticus TaxID=1867 RepID=A0A561VQZ7_ACTTI|nr:hypothetical protein FHX34_104327 [Actinoplanes teichomyceticus]
MATVGVAPGRETVGLAPVETVGVAPGRWKPSGSRRGGETIEATPGRENRSVSPVRTGSVAVVPYQFYL